MLSVKEFVDVLKMEAVLGRREEGCFGSFYPARDEGRPNIVYSLPESRPLITARYEQFTEPETGENLYRFV